MFFRVHAHYHDDVHTLMHAHFIWVHAHFFSHIENPPFQLSFTDSLQLLLVFDGLIPTPPLSGLKL
jgi:hypothetical protein